MNVHRIVIVFFLAISKCRSDYSEHGDFLRNISLLHTQVDNNDIANTYSYTNSNLPHTHEFPEEQSFISRKKAYPFMFHCRGLFQYCWTVCEARLVKICKKFSFLCVTGPVKFNVQKRCRMECLRIYRYLRNTYPIPPKLPRDVKNKFFHPEGLRPRFKDSYESYSVEDVPVDSDFSY